MVYTPKNCNVGLIGLGEMGLPMARNLIMKEFAVTGFDLRQDALDALVQSGGKPAGNLNQLVADCNPVITSLPSNQAFLQVAKESLLPAARQGQVFIETGTTVPYELERLAKLFAAKGATLLDVPVSGGGIGAQRGDLNMFAAGDHEAFLDCRSILAAIGGPDRIHYCGKSGCGQKMKGVNQLKMGLLNAAVIEILAFAKHSGLDLAQLEDVFPDENWQMVTSLAAQILAGKGNELGVKFRELPYYLSEAEKKGFELPITKAVYERCQSGERVTIDDHRQAPSYWHELTKMKGDEKK